MADTNAIVERVLGQLQVLLPAEYERLNTEPAKKELLIGSIKKTAQEEFDLSGKLAGKLEDTTVVKKHLSADRVKMIEGGLRIPTFKMVITKKSDGVYWVGMSVPGYGNYYVERKLDSRSNIDWGEIAEYGSILVEAVMMVISVLGVKIHASPKAIKKAVEAAIDEIKNSSAMQRALEKFVKSWDTAGDDYYEMAKAIFYLVKDSAIYKVVPAIVEALLDDMSWFDWVKTVAECLALIAAAVASGGLALIAKLALAVKDAVEFGLKISNMMQFSALWWVSMHTVPTNRTCCAGFVVDCQTRAACDTSLHCNCHQESRPIYGTKVGEYY